MRNRTIGTALTIAALAIAACNQAATTASAPPQTSAFPEDYGEFYARPEEIASVQANAIAKSMRMNVTAMGLGLQVYDKNCASCHGEDLKGIPAQHTPDLTDSNWRFAGDDLDSAGVNRFPSDVEWTVRYGIRSGHPNARGLEADMVALDPQYRSEEDIKEFGNTRFLTSDEIADVAEYVLQISGQEADAAKAARGNVLFHEGTKGNCFDCHEEQGTGNAPLGSTNLTRKELYLYGSDRAAILESITKGRHGIMPGFDGKLKPEEIKAVAVYVFARAAK
jgi:cytochrome c oxidase cbb3-type subunit 3